MYVESMETVMINLNCWTYEGKYSAKFRCVKMDFKDIFNW